jgi:putative polyhydroxyalkanoate system protein
MADVRVTETHQLAPEEAIRRIASFEEMMSKYGVKSKWSGRSAELKGPGVSGTIDVTPKDATVVVKLGLMAKALGIDTGKLENSIRKRLRAAFDGTAQS